MENISSAMPSSQVAGCFMRLTGLCSPTNPGGGQVGAGGRVHGLGRVSARHQPYSVSSVALPRDGLRPLTLAQTSNIAA